MWYIISDVHGRNSWKTAINDFDPNIDEVIFLGDYLDPYPGESSRKDAIDNFKDIINFKKEYQDKVILLLGNHDLPYYSNEYKGYMEYKCRYDYENYKEIEKLFRKVNFKFIHKVTCREKTILFSHAGITHNWLDVHELTLKELETFDDIRSLAEVSSYRGGYDSWGSFVWADVTEHIYPSSEITDIYQIFGHTYSQCPIISPRFAMLDVGSKVYGVLRKDSTLTIKDSISNKPLLIYKI